MKIISGFLKGRNLDGFDLDGTRPTMNRVKESLFAMIQSYLPDSIVLDLFAGSGNLGIEAISNGSRFVYFNDHNPKAIQTIEKNLNKLQIQSQAIITKLDFKKCLHHLMEEKVLFDIIFLDPPYKEEWMILILQTIIKGNLLKDGGIVVCEFSNNKPVFPPDFAVVKEKKYGDKHVIILQKVSHLDYSML